MFSSLSPDLSVVPTTSGGIHPQTVRSSSSSSSHHASTSELNDAPGPSTSCPGSIPESMHTQRPSGSSRTATEGKTGQAMFKPAAVYYFISAVKLRGSLVLMLHLFSCWYNLRSLYMFFLQSCVAIGDLYFSIFSTVLPKRFPNHIPDSYRWQQTRFVSHSRREHRRGHAQTPIMLSAALPVWRPLSWSPVPEPLPFKLLAGVVISADQRLAAQPQPQSQQCSPLPPPCPSPSTPAPRDPALSRGQLPCGEAHGSACSLRWSQQ